MRHSCRHESDAWPAELQRQTEALSLADRDIDAKLARCAKQSERDTLRGGGNCECARAMGYLGDGAQRLDDAECVGVAGHGAEQPVIRNLIERNRAGRAGRLIEWNFD